MCVCSMRLTVKRGVVGVQPGGEIVQFAPIGSQGVRGCAALGGEDAQVFVD